MLTLVEFAEKVGKSPFTIKRGIQDGRFPEAVKVDGKWMFPEDLELTDRRLKDGEYIGWRKK